MENRSLRTDAGATRWIARLDRIARELNAVLLVLAIGLAALDLTGFVTVTMRDAAPALARASIDPSEAARRAAAQGPSVAVLTPTKPAAQVTGR